MTSNASAVAALPAIVAEHIDAVNAHDTDRIVNTFANDAYVNDNRREIWGADAIWKFVNKEFTGDQVTMEVREVIDHYGEIIVRARFDGTYDKALEARYAGWQGETAKKMLTGESLADIAARVERDNINPQPKSGQQEYYENLVNRFV